MLLGNYFDENHRPTVSCSLLAFPKGPFIFYKVGGAGGIWGGGHAKKMAFKGGHPKKIREKGGVT